MDTELAIRSVQAQDWAQWLPLWQGYNACRADATAVPDEITGMTWQRFFDACEPVHALVAQQGNQLVGLAHYLFHRSTYKLGPNCCLQDLFTVEAVRGQGVGGALIAAVSERAKTGGATSMYWQTRATNPTAIRLYDQMAAKSDFIVYRRDLA